MTDKKRVLFHRDYQAFFGGHLKVFDYFCHTKASERHSPEIFFTPSSKPDHPWRNDPGIVRQYDPEGADCLFLAGMDWRALDSFPGIEDRIPIVNLIQGVRHSFPEDPRYPFLSRRAIRICVSGAIAEALERTGRCNGPIYVIDVGIDLSRLPTTRSDGADVFIAGLKQPRLAEMLRDRLTKSGITADCQTQPIPRPDFLERMAMARIVVTLPLQEEGFFLPPLEAMALGCAVVCPDCIGNRSFCVDGETCLMPPFEDEALEAAVMRLARDPDYARMLSQNGRAMAVQFDIRRERAAYLDILNAL